jgi:CHASE1-domain containing sensor protein
MAHSTHIAVPRTNRYFCHGSYSHVRTGPLVERVNATEPAIKRTRRRRTMWALGAVALVTLGTTGAIFAAVGVTRDAAQKSRQAFAESSTEIASTLKLAIQHEQDLIVSAAGFVMGNPNATEQQFVGWADSVRALERYPELFGFGESVIVPASRL